MTFIRIAADTFQGLHVSVTARASNSSLTYINDSSCVLAILPSSNLTLSVFC